MSARLFPVAALILATTIAVPMAGCSSKPENSPVIRKKFAEVDDLKQDIQETNKMIRTLAGDITIMKDEMSNLRAMAPDANGGVELMSRLEKIEKRLSEIEVENTVMASRATKASNDTPAREAAPAANQIAQATGNASASTKPEVKKTETKPKPVATPAPKRTQPRGRYYTIESGDTIAKIAAANNISESKLREANRLPAGARPLKGQRLFIPNN